MKSFWIIASWLNPVVRNLNPYFVLRLIYYRVWLRVGIGEKEISVLKFYQNRIREKELYINKLLIERLYLLPGVAQVTWQWMFNIFLLKLSEIFTTCMHVQFRKKKVWIKKSCLLLGKFRSRDSLLLLSYLVLYGFYQSLQAYTNTYKMIGHYCFNKYYFHFMTELYMSSAILKLL